MYYSLISICIQYVGSYPYEFYTTKVCPFSNLSFENHYLDKFFCYCLRYWYLIFVTILNIIVIYLLPNIFHHFTSMPYILVLIVFIYMFRFSFIFLWVTIVTILIKYFQDRFKWHISQVWNSQDPELNFITFIFLYIL